MTQGVGVRVNLSTTTDGVFKYHSQVIRRVSLMFGLFRF